MVLRAERASRPGTLISWARMVPVVALAWKTEAGGAREVEGQGWTRRLDDRFELLLEHRFGPRLTKWAVWSLRSCLHRVSRLGPCP